MKFITLIGFSRSRASSVHSRKRASSCPPTSDSEDGQASVRVTPRKRVSESARPARPIVTPATRSSVASGSGLAPGAIVPVTVDPASTSVAPATTTTTSGSLVNIYCFVFVTVIC